MIRYYISCIYKRGGGVPTYVSEICANVKCWWHNAIFGYEIDGTLQRIKEDIEEMRFSGGFTGEQLCVVIENQELRVYNRNRSKVILTILFNPAIR